MSIESVKHIEGPQEFLLRVFSFLEQRGINHNPIPVVVLQPEVAASIDSFTEDELIKQLDEELRGLNRVVGFGQDGHVTSEFWYKLSRLQNLMDIHIAT